MKVADVLVVGAGHNGLVTAKILSAAGYRVKVLEANAQIGGACRSKRIECGCIFALGAVDFGMWHPKVAKACGVVSGDLDLLEHDTEVVSVTDREHYLFYNKSGVTSVSGQHCHTPGEIGWNRLMSDCALTAGLLDETFWEDQCLLQSFEDKLRIVSPSFPIRFLKGSINETVNEYVTDKNLRALLLAMHTLFPKSPFEHGTAFALSYLALPEIYNGGWSSLRGGMQAVADILAKRCGESGVSIQTNTKVVRVTPLRMGKVEVIDSHGSKWVSKYLVFNGAPGRLSEVLNVTNSNCCAPVVDKSLEYSGCARLWLRCDRSKFEAGLQRFDSLGRIGTLICQVSPEQLDLAYVQSSSGMMPTPPLIELNLAGAFQRELCCSRHCAITAFVMYCPHGFGYPLSDGELVRQVKSELEKRVPGLGNSIEVVDVYSARRFDEELLLPFGNIDHGNHSPTNIFEHRSWGVSAFNELQTKGVFLCGAGRHPGGLVSGIPGMLAARDIMRCESSHFLDDI